MNRENDFIPFALPDINEDDIAEVVDTLRSGWLSTGPKTKKFEQDFLKFLGEDAQAIALNSATAGLHLALEAMGVGPGDEVITTTYTFTATAEIVRYLGAHPVLVDVDPATLCMDMTATQSALTERTKVVIPVHFGGYAADVYRLREIIGRSAGVSIVEDAAHACPATLRGKLVGTLPSEATVFSFYANKTMTTGEGGMLVTRSARVAERVRIMRLHGISRDAFDRFTSRAPGWYYEVVAPGFKYNMPDIAAALGIQQLKRIWRFQERRERIAEYYSGSFADLPMSLPPRPNGERHSWHLYLVQLADGANISRDEFIEKMHRAGVGCSVHYIPLHQQPYWRDTYKLTPAMFPNAERIWRRAVSLPIYSRMTDVEVERVVQTVKGILS